MRSDVWRAVLGGDATDLRLVAPFVDDAHVRIVDTNGAHFLLSQRFDELTYPSDVYAAACTLVQLITGAANVRLGKRIEVTVSGVVPPGGDTDQPHQFVVVPTITSRAQVFPPTLLAAGQPPARPPSLGLEFAQPSGPVELVFRLLSEPPTWTSLANVVDAIEEDVGGDAALRGRPWAWRSELRRFKGTANSIEASGMTARHAKRRFRPPKHPMSLAEAEEFVRRLTSAWIGEKYSKPER